MADAPDLRAPHPLADAWSPWPLVDADTMRRLDRHTIETLGITGEVLMESAGRAVVEAVLAVWSDAGAGADAEVCVVCGGGNNGGDGFVVARQLHQLGLPVRVVLLGEPKKLRGDAASNHRRALAVGVPVAAGGTRWRASGSGVVVDAIFGTGLARGVAGPAAAAIRKINAAHDAGAWVVAVDVPSGIDSDTGAVHGVAVEADCTVTISLPKLGLALEPGRSHAGQVRVARIGIADAAPDAVPAAELWTPVSAGAALPERPIDGHKGTFGHLLLVAGGEGKTGAAALGAQSAVRAGAGLVTVACPAGLNDILEVKCTEAMTVPVPDTERRAFAAAAEDAIVGLAAERDVVACGPGLGREPETGDLVRALVKRIEQPLVLDADGLFPFGCGKEGCGKEGCGKDSGGQRGGGKAAGGKAATAKGGAAKRRAGGADRDALAALRARRAPTVLTPHPGEAAHLLGLSAAELGRDRAGAARALAEATGAVVVLKGAATAIAAPDGRLAINPTGGPLLASGGTGDVLTGVVAAYLAQGLPPFEAATAAVYVHGAAADALADELGGSGLLAGELAEVIPVVAESLRRRVADPDSEGSAAGGLLLPFPGR